jgi:hypothetical protein
LPDLQGAVMRFAFVLFAVGFLLPGCSSQQMYAAGQGYQRNQCLQLPDAAERQRCLEQANMSYDQYRRETKGESK